MGGGGREEIDDCLLPREVPRKPQHGAHSVDKPSDVSPPSIQAMNLLNCGSILPPRPGPHKMTEQVMVKSLFVTPLQFQLSRQPPSKVSLSLVPTPSTPRPFLTFFSDGGLAPVACALRCLLALMHLLSMAH